MYRGRSLLYFIFHLLLISNESWRLYGYGFSCPLKRTRLYFGVQCRSFHRVLLYSFSMLLFIHSLSPALSSPSGALLSPFHLARECNGHVVDHTVWSASITGSLLRSRRRRRYQISCRDLSFFLQDCKISFYLRHLTVKKGSCSPP